MKWVFFFSAILVLVLFSFQQDRNNTIELKDKVYYSVQKGNTLYCSVYYHFDNDSLYVYNSATDQKLKYKISYKNDYVVINNKSVNNYILKFLKSDNKTFNLIDKSNFIGLNDTIKLKRVNIGDNLNFDFKNKMWGAKLFNVSNIQMDSLWLNFNIKGDVDIYSKDKNMDEISLSKSKYEIINLSNKLKIIDISNQTISFLMLNNTKDSLSFFTSRCEEPYENNLYFTRYKNKTTKNYIKDWVKVSSENEFELPQELWIKKDFIILDGKIMNYNFGLDNKFILLEDGNYFKIINLSNETLSISIINSVKELEKATYKLR